MPRYGKRAMGSSPDTYVYYGRKITGKTISGPKRLQYDLRTFTYGINGTPLKVVNSHLRHRLLPEIEKLLAHTKRPVIAEWGADKGTALFHLARIFPTARFIGTSQESHAEWETRPQNTTMLLTTGNAIKKLAGKKSSKGKVDLIFTHSGLFQLTKISPQTFVTHVIALGEALRKGGKILLPPKEFPGMGELRVRFGRAEQQKILHDLEQHFHLVLERHPNRAGKQQTYIVELIKK